MENSITETQIISFDQAIDSNKSTSIILLENLKERVQFLKEEMEGLLELFKKNTLTFSRLMNLNLSSTEIDKKIKTLFFYKESVEIIVCNLDIILDKISNSSTIIETFLSIGVEIRNLKKKIVPTSSINTTVLDITNESLFTNLEEKYSKQIKELGVLIEGINFQKEDLIAKIPEKSKENSFVVFNCGFILREIDEILKTISSHSGLYVDLNVLKEVIKDFGLQDKLQSKNSLDLIDSINKIDNIFKKIHGDQNNEDEINLLMTEILKENQKLELTNENPLLFEMGLDDDIESDTYIENNILE
jgi:hypothetical protein